MRKLLQINPVIRESTSTGRIMREIGEAAMAAGWESWIAYSKGRDGEPEHSSHLLPIGNKVDVALHAIATRLFDAHGLASRLATKRFIKQVRQLDPDVIHIHNIHGYFLNYKLLFKYLKESGKPVIWTVHDCWLYTGHCYYYSSIGCEKWKSHCHNCPQKRAFPTSWFLDRSYKNFEDKKNAFNALGDRLTIVTVSDWIRGEMHSSLLGNCRFKVIHNGIDLDIFQPVDSTPVLEKYGLTLKRIILGVASIWMKEKGLDDFAKLAHKIPEQVRNDAPSSLPAETSPSLPADAGNLSIVLVGKMTPEQKAALPENIVTIPRTADARELAALYSAASVFVNPTWQDNYPTVNLEALACGTPVITYRTGGSPEALGEEIPGTSPGMTKWTSPGMTVGSVVEQGDVGGLLKSISAFMTADRAEISKTCRKFAVENFDKRDRYKDYIGLYNDMTK